MKTMLASRAVPTSRVLSMVSSAARTYQSSLPGPQVVYLGALRAILARSLEEQALAPCRARRWLRMSRLCPVARLAVERIIRVLHEAAVGFAGCHLSREPSITSGPCSMRHVAFGDDVVRRLVVAHPVGEHRLAALAQAHVAFRFDFLFGVPAQRIGLEKGRHILLELRGNQQQSRLRLELEALLRAGGYRQGAHDGERDAL